MNVMILAAGTTPANLDTPAYPLCLSELGGTPLIELQIASCQALGKVNFHFAFNNEEIRRFHLDKIVELLAPSSNILSVQQSTKGAACTALLAVGEIDNQDELLILNGNELLDIDFIEILTFFRNSAFGAGVVTFPSIHPRYSFVRLNTEGLVIEAAEKNPISRHATVGFYWFARGQDFVKAAKNMIRKDALVGEAFYICPALNELVLDQVKIGHFEIEAAKYYPLKTEHQVHKFDTSLSGSQRGSL
jgi:NDP-sugar pyrophosphorylase family protein